MRVASMGIEIAVVLILLGSAIGVHVDQDKADLEARAALPQPSWVNLGPMPFGGLPRQADIVARTVPLETLATRAATPDGSTEHSESSA